jgi:hypothetical protein
MKYAHPIFITAIAVTLTFVLTGVAQYELYSTPEFPIPDQVNKLFILSDNWQGEAEVALNGEEIPKFQVTHGAFVLANSRGIRIDYRGIIPGYEDFKSINILGYNVGDSSMHFFTIDSFGNTYDRRGYWVDDHHLYFTYHGTYNGKQMSEHLPITIIDDYNYTIADTVWLDDNVVFTADAKMTKL